MGTLVEVRAAGPEAAVHQAVASALERVARVDRLMSFHDPDSELSRLNREAAREPQPVDPWTWIVLGRALRFSRASDGLFDVTVAPLLVREGLLPGEPGAALAHGGWRHLVLLPGRRVSFDRPLQVDLGGIAKGFAVDLAIHALREGGCTRGVVNAGGDLRRFGSGVEPVHLRRGEGLVKAAELRCGAIATSAPLAAHAGRLAQPLGSIFDPRSALPWKSGGAVMVAAPSCIAADALTKVAALAGPSCGPLLARFGARAYRDPANA
jgi:thiamine biosynthesis lipoprotein